MLPQSVQSFRHELVFFFFFLNQSDVGEKYSNVQVHYEESKLRLSTPETIRLCLLEIACK